MNDLDFPVREDAPVSVPQEACDEALRRMQEYYERQKEKQA